MNMPVFPPERDDDPDNLRPIYVFERCVEMLRIMSKAMRETFNTSDDDTQKLLFHVETLCTAGDLCIAKLKSQKGEEE